MKNTSLFSWTLVGMPLIFEWHWIKEVLFLFLDATKLVYYNNKWRNYFENSVPLFL